MCYTPANMEIIRTGAFIVMISTWIRPENSNAAEGVNFFDFLTSSPTKDNQRISFSPDDGKKFRRLFEQKFGHRGKLLIESMGQGPTALISRMDKIKGSGNGTKNILKIEKRIASSTLTPNIYTSLVSSATEMTPSAAKSAFSS